MSALRTIDLTIAGLGIILYSPRNAAHIARGSDYLSEHFWEPEDVERSLLGGKISAFGTGGGGDYALHLFEGPADDEKMEAHRYKLRLGVEVVGGQLCFRDLYDMLEWEPEVPDAQRLRISDGTYRLTLLTNKPASGWFGDHQRIDIHLEKWDGMPRLRFDGVPVLNED
jgi:hypothetical protein